MIAWRAPQLLATASAMHDKGPHSPMIIDAALLDRFTQIVGERHALRASADIAPYQEEPRGLFGGMTPLVLRPGSVDEVSRILALASETGTPIVPQGGNTGLVGGQMPDGEGREIVLSGLDAGNTRFTGP